MIEALQSIGLELLPGILGHRDPFARLETFHQFDFKPLLFQAFEVLPDEPPDIVARRAVMGSEAALLDELFKVFRERDSHGAGVARHRPTVSLDIISLMASSCGYYRGQIEDRVAQ
jgi:hypothetical protein